jgi:hypothetical protein
MQELKSFVFHVSFFFFSGILSLMLSMQALYYSSHSCTNFVSIFIYHFWMCLVKTACNKSISKEGLLHLSIFLMDMISNLIPFLTLFLPTTFYLSLLFYTGCLRTDTEKLTLWWRFVCRRLLANPFWNM